MKRVSFKEPNQLTWREPELGFHPEVAAGTAAWPYGLRGVKEKPEASERTDSSGTRKNLEL